MQCKINLVGMLLVLAGILIVGCATGSYSLATPEEEITQQMEKWSAALISKDIDSIMALFSDKFTHSAWGDKEGARAFIEEAISGGYLDGVKVLLDDAKIKADGDVGSVYPVDIDGSFGSLSMELIVGRENGKWLLTSMDAPGL